MSNEEVLKSLGRILNAPMPRDAVHIAVVPVRATEKLMPGQRVGVQMLSDGEWTAIPDSYRKRAVGIIDPFLDCEVEQGERCWLFLMPGSITSLHHNWEHPMFATPPPQASPSERWMITYAASLGVSYEELLSAADGYLRSGDYYNEGDKFDGVSLDHSFWEHYGNIRGVDVVKTKQNDFFSCAC